MLLLLPAVIAFGCATTNNKEYRAYAAPTIEKLAKDYAGKVKVGKVDTDANRDVSMRYGISAIPTVILFKNGEVAQKFVGLRQEKEFKEVLDAQG